MKRGRRVVSIFILSSLFFLLNSAAVKAQYGAYGQYGAPSVSKSILIEKMVAKPSGKDGASDFVDNLSPSDPRFAPEQQVVFRLTVKNTSDTTLTNVQVKDTVPLFLDVVSAPAGFDAASRTISFGAGDFGPNEQKTFTLTFTVARQDKLPQDRGVICLVNKAEASTEGASDEDSSQFCIEKQVIGAQAVPTAGPEMGLALIGVELGLLSTGLYLKRRSAR